jgi:hypothetical protein
MLAHGLPACIGLQRMEGSTVAALPIPAHPPQVTGASKKLLYWIQTSRLAVPNNAEDKLDSAVSDDAESCYDPGVLMPPMM